MIGEISTDESLYVTTLSGDTYLLEVRENNGLVTISFGDILNITVSKSEAYDIVDTISLVLSSIPEQPLECPLVLVPPHPAWYSEGLE